MRVEELRKKLDHIKATTASPRRVQVAKKCHEIDEQTLEMVRTKIRAAAYVAGRGYRVESLFEKLDKDGSGEISYEELRQGLRSACRISPFEMSDAQFTQLFLSLDADASGEIGVEEIFNFAVGEYKCRREREAKYLEDTKKRRMGCV